MRITLFHKDALLEEMGRIDFAMINRSAKYNPRSFVHTLHIFKYTVYISLLVYSNNPGKKG